MAEQQEQEQPQRRRSFDDVLKDALTQWTKRFERALEEQRQALGQEAQERVSDMEALALKESATFAAGRDFRRLLPIRPPEELRWLVVPLVTAGV